MTDEELRRIAADDQLVSRMADEFREGLKRKDAFDFFAEQSASSKSTGLITYLCGMLFCTAIVLFIMSIIIAVALGTTAWPFGMCLAACALTFTATVLGTFTPGC